MNLVLKMAFFSSFVASAMCLPVHAREIPRDPFFGEAAGMYQDCLRSPRFLHGLMLNEVQRDEIFAILHEQAPVVRKKLNAARQTRNALHDLSFSSLFDEVKARALAESEGKLLMELTLLESRSEQMIYALLTSEQRKQIETIKASRYRDGSSFVHCMGKSGEPRT